MGLSGTESVSRIVNHSAVKFVVVGGLSLVTDTSALYVFHGLLTIWLPVAVVLAFAVAFVVNFGLNRLWSFESSSEVGRQLWRYLFLVLANLALTVVLVQALTWAGLPYLVAKVITSVALVPLNYGASRKWVFT